MPLQPPDRKDDEVLEEIRERWTYASRAWADIREEGQKDMRYVAGDPWDAKDRKDREDAGRTCLSLDELGQYTNQIINDVRQNKRGVKVTPIGNGANDKTAELRQNLMRQIEYRSNAQTYVYAPMFEDTVQRSYGFGRVAARYVSDTSRDQELILEALPNPDLVTLDPDGTSPTGSDITYAFIHESRSVKQFKKDFPDASITDFTDEVRKLAPDWVKSERIQIAEYWTIEHVRSRVVFLKANPSVGVHVAEMPEPPPANAIDFERYVDVPFVCHYLTNGVELLAKNGEPKRTAWPGKWIPIVACYGKTLYVSGAAGTERRMLSMIRLARDPYMLYCYYRTCEAELVGMTPKTPFIGYEGQFRGHETDWQKSSHEPVAFLQARAQTEATGSQVLPLPQRQPYDPPIQALEIGAEAARRAIQAAMGTSPLPTSAQRKNEKSGEALRQIEDSSQKGSYHFVDHFDASITRFGEILDDLIPHYYDAARDVTIREGNDEPKQVRINDPKAQGGYLSATEGQHDVTLSVGPAEASQRKAAEDFADTLAQNQTVFPLIADLVVKLKQLGPIGDEIADRLTPPQFKKPGQPPSPADVAQMQTQMQQMQQALQEAQKAIETDQAKQQATIQTAQLKEQAETERERMRIEADLLKSRADNAAKIEVARIGADKQLSSDVVKAQEERVATGLTIAAKAEAQVRDHEHETVLKAMDHAHAAANAVEERDASAEAADAQRAHEAEMAARSAAAQPEAGA